MPSVLIFEDNSTKQIVKIFIKDKPEHFTTGYLTGMSRMNYYACSGNEKKGFLKGPVRGSYDFKLLKNETTIKNKKKCAICKYFTACSVPKGNSSLFVRAGITLSMIEEFGCALKEDLIEKNKTAISNVNKTLIKIIKVEKVEESTNLYKPI